MAMVTLTADAEEDLRDLDRSAQLIVLKAIRKLETDPDKRGQPLGSMVGGNLTGWRKLVVGKRTYRVVYRVESSGAVVVVFVIAKRADNEVYELAVARLRLHDDPQVRGFADSLAELLPVDLRELH
jgi:mRNA interferase RelE/StbE